MVKVGVTLLSVTHVLRALSFLFKELFTLKSAHHPATNDDLPIEFFGDAKRQLNYLYLYLS